MCSGMHQNDTIGPRTGPWKRIMKKLNAAALESLKPRETAYDEPVGDRSRLYIRVQPTGVKSARLRYMRAGERDWFTFGNTPPLTISHIIEMHRQAEVDLEKGLDPKREHERRQAEKEKATQEHIDAGTVADLVEQFTHRELRGERRDPATGLWVRDLKCKSKARKRPEQADALLSNNLVNASLDGQKVGTTLARDLSRRQVARVLEAIVDRGSPVTANKVHALLVQMFNFAADKEIVPASPVAGMRRPGGAETPRKRKLSDEEIITFWTKLDTANMRPATKVALRLLLVTGQRRGELTFSERVHFDIPGKKWTIPVELLKSEGRRKEPTEPHTVPLSDLALELLTPLTATPASRWLLPSAHRKRKDGPYSKNALTHAVRDNLAHFGLQPFTVHDLRRTVASHMTKLGVTRLVVHKVQNHATGDKMGETYDQHDYAAEKRAALAKWAKHLRKLIAKGGEKSGEEKDELLKQAA